jgi:hypothetical protein
MFEQKNCPNLSGPGIRLLVVVYDLIDMATGCQPRLRALSIRA